MLLLRYEYRYTSFPCFLQYLYHIGPPFLQACAMFMLLHMHMQYMFLRLSCYNTMHIYSFFGYLLYHRMHIYTTTHTYFRCYLYFLDLINVLLLKPLSIPYIIQCTCKLEQKTACESPLKYQSYAIIKVRKQIYLFSLLFIVPVPYRTPFSLEVCCVYVIFYAYVVHVSASFLL